MINPIIYRNPRFSSDLPMHVGRVRALSLGLPALYLIGCVMAAVEWGPAEGVTGLMLMMTALLGAVLPLQFTGVHRIAHEHPEHLDDGERMFRDRTLARSYRIFTGAVVIGLVYADIAPDLNRKLEWALPLPQQDLLYTVGGVILLALLLPSALLAWRLPVAELTAD
jgi:uncharacterized membrane protein YhdT